MEQVQEVIELVGAVIGRFIEWYPVGVLPGIVSVIVGVLLGAGIWILQNKERSGPRRVINRIRRGLRGRIFFGRDKGMRKEDLIRMAVVDLVLDGDTVRLDSGEIIRIIGIDARESGTGDKVHNDAFHTGVDVISVLRQGQYASMWVRGLIEGRRVWVENDPANHPDHVDAYGRELAHIWTCDQEGKPSNLVSVMIAEAGLGVPTSFPHLYEDHVRAARGIALRTGRGRYLGVREVER